MLPNMRPRCSRPLPSHGYLATRLCTVFATPAILAGFGVVWAGIYNPPLPLQERTRIKYLTDGVLLREMMDDPLLTQYRWGGGAGAACVCVCLCVC